MKILLVEDDPKIASFIADGLRRSGSQVDVAENGFDGLQLGRSRQYDAAVVDVMLPQLDGLRLIECLRDEGNQLPVLVLSAKREVDDRVAGLSRGGDDYLTKPFAFSELVARLHALVRRVRGEADPAQLTYHDLLVDVVTRRVSRAGKEIELQPKEFDLLRFLMQNAGQVVSKTMIMEHVWGLHFDPGTNVVEARICRLRNKVDKGFDCPLLHTVRGVGYVITSRL